MIDLLPHVSFIQSWKTEKEDLEKLTRISYAWAAGNVGVSFPLFESPKISLPYLQGNVIPAIRKVLACIDGKIHLDNTMIQTPLQKKNDVCLMDVAISKKFTSAKLKRINVVCKYSNLMSNISVKFVIPLELNLLQESYVEINQIKFVSDVIRANIKIK